MITYSYVSNDSNLALDVLDQLIILHVSGKLTAARINSLQSETADAIVKVSKPCLPWGMIICVGANIEVKVDALAEVNRLGTRPELMYRKCVALVLDKTYHAKHEDNLANFLQVYSGFTSAFSYTDLPSAIDGVRNYLHSLET